MNTPSTLRSISITTGMALIVMAIFAIIAVGVVQSTLIHLNDPAATVTQIRESMGLFSLGIFSWLMILICDVLAAWGLFLFFKPQNGPLSLLAAWFRLTYAALLGLAVVNLMFVALLLQENSLFSAFPPNQVEAMTLFFIGGFNKVWSFGLIIFGVHLCLIGFIILKAVSMPKWLGALLLLAAFSYISVHSVHLFLPQFNDGIQLAEKMLSLPMAIAELSLAFYLILRGGKSTSKHAS